MSAKNSGVTSFYIQKGNIAVDRIHFDSQLYEKIVNTSKKIYEKYIVNALLNKK